MGRKRSRLEERFAPFLRLRRLPLPRFNDWIEAGDRRYQVDCHWPELRQIVELDGWDAHSTRTAFREDRARDRRLAADLRALLARPRQPARPGTRSAAGARA